MAKVIGERQDRQVAVNVKSGKEEEAKKKRKGELLLASRIERGRTLYNWECIIERATKPRREGR